ncbi:hypothetical protein L195_g038705, partial [Trifolium pratense]
SDNETLYDVWERFKLCLKKCPNHGFDGHSQMQMFTQGLCPQTCMILDASAGGSLKNKDETEARELVKSMTQNEYRTQNDRGAKKKGEYWNWMLKVNYWLNKSSEEAKYLANFRKSYPNNNNLGYGWGNTQGQASAQQSIQPRPPSRMEETLTKFI